MNEQDIYEKSRSSYSHDRYGKKAWMNAIALLLAAKYTPDQVVEILLSKYMRWAADSFSLVDDEFNETCTGDEIVQYRDKWGIDVKGLMECV